MQDLRGRLSSLGRCTARIAQTLAHRPVHGRGAVSQSTVPSGNPHKEAVILSQSEYFISPSLSEAPNTCLHSYVPRQA